MTSDWAAARGDKWAAHLAAMEATLAPVDAPLLDALLALLASAGFLELAVSDWRGALPLGGNLPPADAARFALSAFASFGDLLATATPEARDEAHRSLTSQFAAHHDAGAVRLPAHVRIVTGTAG